MPPMVYMWIFSGTTQPAQTVLVLIFDCVNNSLPGLSEATFTSYGVETNVFAHSSVVLIKPANQTNLHGR